MNKSYRIFLIVILLVLFSFVSGNAHHILAQDGVYEEVVYTESPYNPENSYPWYSIKNENGPIYTSIYDLTNSELWTYIVLEIISFVFFLVSISLSVVAIIYCYKGTSKSKEFWYLFLLLGFLFGWGIITSSSYLIYIKLND